MKRLLTRALGLLLCLTLAVGLGGCLLPDSVSDFSGDESPLDIGSPYKHYFEQLSTTEKYAYNAILSVISDFPERIEVPVLTQEELHNMYTALLYDNPELFFLSGDTVLRHIKKRAYIYPDYRIAAADYSAMYRKCSEIAAQIVEEALAEKSDFKRERMVHDRLIAMCSYTDDDANIYKGTIYGALCGGKAACEGYAKTTKFLLDRLDIPCFVVIGNSTPPGSRTETHMWNAVQVDGDWYHLDLTWDDPVLEKGGDLIRYSFFNVTDDALHTTHADYDTGVSCTATKDNFFVHEKLLFSRFGDDETKRAAAFAARIIDLGSDGFQIRFADKKAFESAQEKLFKQEKIYALLKQIGEKVQRSFATDRVSYYTTDTDLTIEIILES